MEAENYHLSKSGETVSFTIPEALISVIRYEHNDGSGLYDEEASARIMNEPVEIKSSTDERKGYQFTGWNTSPDGSGTNYTPGSMYTEDADLTLYAQWEPLSLLSLPSGLTEIEEEAFSGGGVVVVTIPDGCVSIGARAFAGCEDLAEIFIPESVTDIDDTAFDGCNDLVIWGKAGSFAELFSNENGICFYEIND